MSAIRGYTQRTMRRFGIPEKEEIASCVTVSRTLASASYDIEEYDEDTLSFRLYMEEPDDDEKHVSVLFRVDAHKFTACVTGCVPGRWYQHLGIPLGTDTITFRSRSFWIMFLERCLEFVLKLRVMMVAARKVQRAWRRWYYTRATTTACSPSKRMRV